MTEVRLTVVQPIDAYWPAHLSQRLGAAMPSSLHAVGPVALRQKGVSRAEARELRRYRRFYLVYPHIRESLTPELRRLLPVQNSDTRKMRDYQLELPSKEDLQRFLQEKRREINDRG